FAAAIEVLEKALASAGQSPELNKLLQVTREQWAETQKDERVTQVMGGAEAAWLEEDYDEAIRLLERGQKELKATALTELLTSARDQTQASRRRREDLVARAQEVLQGGEPPRAVALLDSAPKSFFKNDAFQRVYAACREGLDRSSFIRTAVEQMEKCLAGEDVAQAEGVLQHALQSYPDDATLVATHKRLRE